MVDIIPFRISPSIKREPSVPYTSARPSSSAVSTGLPQLAFTDLDILSENVGLENLCLVYALKKGGILSVKRFYDILYGQQKENDQMAQIIMEQAASLPFMKKK